MPRWLAVSLLAFAFALPAAAQDVATLGKLPDLHIVIALKTGEWDDLGDKIGEALDEAQDAAEDRDIELTKNEVVIYEVMGLKTFRIRAGYVVDGKPKAKPGRLGKSAELRRLNGPAYVMTGTGGAAAVIPIRRKVLDQVEKPGVNRAKGIETIEIFYGDMDDNETKVEVYGPLR